MPKDFWLKKLQQQNSLASQTGTLKSISDRDTFQFGKSLTKSISGELASPFKKDTKS